MRQTIVGLIWVLLLPPVHGAKPITRGFPPDQIEQERRWEEKARAATDAEHIGRYMKHISLRPHLAGTPASHAIAEYLLGMLQQWGLDAHIEEYEALLPTPKSRSLELTAPNTFRARLQEPPLAVDATSSDKDEVATYNAYSGSGDVTAPLVYANHGMPEDYEYLARNGIDVRGKIVITRYGGGWRGLKPRLAQEHGATGCIIYSDPKDDGYYRGEVYPRGMWRPADGVQRGSVMDMTLYPGDPLSPGWASEPGSKRLAISEAKTLMKIPVMPISYGDALPIMEALDGPVAPEDWRGAFGFTYHIGSGAAKARLRVEMDNATHPVYDVIARIPGSEFPDELVLAGNHHDAWVHGAIDPVSGASALLETARALGGLLHQGWRPRRTIMIAFWDAEEFGLVGSTEFAEKHADELSRGLVAYINSDSNGKGKLGMGGSHTLEQFAKEIADDLRDPVSGKPLAENMRPDSSIRTDHSAAKPPAPSPDTSFHLEALGSGSDYTSFLQHLGIASLNFGFGDESGAGGIYHSSYDSYYWYTHFSDTNFAYGKALASVTGTALLRLGDAPVLPFEFTRFSGTVSRYLEEIEKLEQAAKLDLKKLKQQLADLKRSADAFEIAYAHALGKLNRAPASQLAQVNALLFQTERKMLIEEGLPRRDWFKHAIYAPGTLTGYGVKTLPGIREAVEANHAAEAQSQADRAADVIRTLNHQVQEASRLLSGL